MPFLSSRRWLLTIATAGTLACDVPAWMQREIAGLSSHPEPSAHHAPFAEPLPPDGQFVRVHLRPYLARGGAPAVLLRAFIATANGSQGDTAQFACAERALSSLAQGRVVTDGLELFHERRRTGFEAAHHSPAFAAAYAPAYRVISASWLARLMDASSLSSSRRD